VFLSVISGLHRDVDEICALLGYYAALSGSYIPTFRENLSDLSGAHPEFFIGGEGGGAEPEAICNLCLILKIML
jgi:hypothetical protein